MHEGRLGHAHSIIIMMALRSLPLGGSGRKPATNARTCPYSWRKVSIGNSKINRLTTSLDKWLLRTRYCRISSGFGHQLDGLERTVRVRKR